MSIIDHDSSKSPAILSNPELAMAYIRFCAQGLGIETFDDFNTWINVGLKRFFPHDAFLAFFSTFDSDDGEFKVSHLTTIDFQTFHRIPGMVDQSHIDMLKLLTPHLHAVYTRVVALAQADSRSNSLPDLSPDEMEILHWLVRGKSNWEISAITGRSQAMVKRHVSNLLAKLDVGSRVQAAAKAVDLGLVTPPLQRAAGTQSSLNASRTYPDEGTVLPSRPATRPES